MEEPPVLFRKEVQVRKPEVLKFSIYDWQFPSSRLAATHLEGHHCHNYLFYSVRQKQINKIKKNIEDENVVAP